MGKFELSTGDVYEVPNHEGKFVRILIARKYLDGYSEDLPMKDKFKEMSEEKIVVIKDMYDFMDDKSFKVENTYVVAENKEYIDLPEVDYYLGNFSSNSEYFHKVQLDFNTDGWKKRIFIDWKDSGSSCMNYFDFVSNIADFLDESILSGDLSAMGIKLTESSIDGEEELSVSMYNDNGEFENCYFSLREFKSSLVSVKLVNFESKIYK